MDLKLNENEIDIKILVSNAKIDKRFNKLLNLCIKYDIQLLNQNNNVCYLYKIDYLLNQCNQKQNQLLQKLINKINNINSNENFKEKYLNIEYYYNNFKKEIKDLDIIIYILKNSYDDNSLSYICNNQIINNNSSSSSSIKEKQINSSKYIAVYSN